MKTESINEKSLSEILCKDIIELLQKKMHLQHIRVSYDEKAVIKERLKHGRHIVFFTPIDSESEREKYERKAETAKIKYKTKSPMIHFPNVAVDELVQIFQCGAEDEYTNTILRLKKEYDIEADKFIFVSFIFLHEIGHWNQLENDDRIVYKYLLRNLTEERNNHDAQKKILTIALNRNGLNELGQGLKLTIKEKKALEDLQEEYRHIPKEAEADEYAVKMLKSVDLTNLFLEISER